jgi:acyl carrier protein
MPTDADIYSALTEIFRDVFMRDDMTLRPELSAINVEGWDSFKQIEIIMATEEQFAFKMTTQEIDSLQSVGDLVRVVEGRAAFRAP